MQGKNGVSYLPEKTSYNTIEVTTILKVVE